MEDFNNLDRSKATYEYSSDESVYFSASDSLDLPPYEEFDNHSYLSESDNSSIYSGICDPVIGEVNTTIYPATADYIEVLGIFPVEVRGTTYYQPLFYYVPVYNDTDYFSSDSDAYYTAQESQSYFDSDESDYEAEEIGYFSETNVETTSFESFEFSAYDDFDLSEDKEYLASESIKDNYEEEGRDNIDTAADIESNKFDKHRPPNIGDINERNNFPEKCPINAFDFEDVNSKYCQNHGLKKYNSFDDLAGKKQGQSLKKHESSENLSQFEDNEIYKKDYQRENTEIRMDNYDQNKKSLSPPPDDFELTEEEVKYLKDDIYRRALSGKLYQKTHIPSVDVLPTIHEENESFGEINEQADSWPLGLTEVDSQPSCFIEADSPPSCLTEHQGLLNGSLCNLFEPSEDNGEDSKKSQQKPKKKKMKRLREFLARIFCCVKPP